MTRIVVMRQVVDHLRKQVDEQHEAYLVQMGRYADIVKKMKSDWMVDHAMTIQQLHDRRSASIHAITSQLDEIKAELEKLAALDDRISKVT